MFRNSPFNQDISSWGIRNVVDIEGMFYKTPFDQDISKWEFNSISDTKIMFQKNEQSFLQYNYPIANSLRIIE